MAEGEAEAGASFSSQDLALLAQLPPQVSLKFAQACPWPIAAEILGSALAEHWLEDELLLSNAAWLVCGLQASWPLALSQPHACASAPRAPHLPRTTCPPGRCAATLAG
jgi:hypothetical protein